MGLGGAGGVKSLSVGICDGAPSTVRSSFYLGRLPLLPGSHLGQISAPSLLPGYENTASCQSGISEVQDF